MVSLFSQARRLSSSMLVGGPLVVALAIVAMPATAQQQPQQNSAQQPAGQRPLGGQPAGQQPAAGGLKPIGGGGAGTASKEPSPEAKAEAEAAMARYRVPETKDVDELLTFIDSVRRYEPRDIQNFQIHRKQAPRAVRAAAQKVMMLEKDPSSKKYIIASTLVLIAELSMLDELTPVEQKGLVDEVTKRLSMAQPPNEDYYLALQVAMRLEMSSNKALAAQAYADFAKGFAAASDPEIVQMAKPFEAAAGRLNLIGKPIEVFGQTIAGQPMDWRAYRGKVVLVDFWFIACPLCKQELPKIKRLYELYHDRGFDVVGVNVDESRDEVQAYLHDEQIPWTTLFDSKGQDEHPMAERYGVMAYPTVMLIGKDGKVLSFDARGDKLEQLLVQLLGPAGDQQANPKTAKGPVRRPAN